MKNITQLMAENRWCYFIPPQDGERGFIPALVIEDQPGYRKVAGFFAYQQQMQNLQIILLLTVKSFKQRRPVSDSEPNPVA